MSVQVCVCGGKGCGEGGEGLCACTGSTWAGCLPLTHSPTRTQADSAGRNKQLGRELDLLTQRCDELQAELDLTAAARLVAEAKHKEQAAEYESLRRQKREIQREAAALRERSPSPPARSPSPAGAEGSPVASRRVSSQLRELEAQNSLLSETTNKLKQRVRKLKRAAEDTRQVHFARPAAAAALPALPPPAPNRARRRPGAQARAVLAVLGVGGVIAPRRKRLSRLTHAAPCPCRRATGALQPQPQPQPQRARLAGKLGTAAASSDEPREPITQGLRRPCLDTRTVQVACRDAAGHACGRGHPGGATAFSGDAFHRDTVAFEFGYASSRVVL